MSQKNKNRKQIEGDPFAKAQYNELQVQDLTKHIVGEILTIVDATMEDPIRRKAMKDLVVARLWDANWKVVEWMKEGGKEENFPFRTYSYNPDIPRD